LLAAQRRKGTRVDEQENVCDDHWLIVAGVFLLFIVRRDEIA